MRALAVVGCVIAIAAALAPNGKARLADDTIRHWIAVGRCEQPGPGAFGVRWDHPGPTYQGGLGFYWGTWRWWASELRPGGVSVYERFPNAGLAPWRVQVWVAQHGWERYRGSWGCHARVGWPPRG